MSNLCEKIITGAIYSALFYWVAHEARKDGYKQAQDEVKDWEIAHLRRKLNEQNEKNRRNA